MADKDVKAPMGKQINMVEYQATMKENIKREMRGRKYNENFDFNPKSLQVITDKPTLQSKIVWAAGVPGLEQKAEYKESSQEAKVLQEKVNQLVNVPKKKYKYPATSAQEVGWDDQLFNAHKPKYNFNRRMFAETKYASTYAK